MKFGRRARNFLADRWIDIVFVILYSFSVAGIILEDVANGWDKECTLRVILLGAIIVSGIFIAPGLNSYAIRKQALVIKSNNDLYRYIEKLEKENRLSELHQKMNDDEKQVHLDHINKLLRSKNQHHVNLTKLNIESFMTGKEYENSSYDLNKRQKDHLVSIYVKYQTVISVEYEKLYADYKSSELIKPAKFPFVTSALPLLLSLVGIIISVVSGTGDAAKLKPALLYGGVFFLFLVRYVLSSVLEPNGKTNKMIGKNLYIMSLV